MENISIAPTSRIFGWRPSTCERKLVVGSVPVGRYPYALTVAGNQVYVANIGLFEYSPIPPPKGKDFDKRGLTFPPFGFPSKEARDGVEMEGRKIPGLGEPNVPESFSVWGVDVSHPDSLKVTTRMKTGLLIGAPTDNGKAVGGSAPNFLATHGDSLFVSNGNNDMIERVDLATNKIVAKERLSPSPLVAKLRGVSPAGMAVSPDGRRLYVAELGINAIAVLDAKTLGGARAHSDRVVSLPRRAVTRRHDKLFASAFAALATDRTPARRSPRAISWTCAAWSASSIARPDSELRP